MLERFVRESAFIKKINVDRVEIVEMIRLLQLKSYSINTRRNYTNAFSSFLDHYYPRTPEELSRKEIENYLLYLALSRQSSETAINTAINSIKFYFEYVLKKPKVFYDFPRPKKPIQNPAVFGKSEIERIIKAIPNLKHKAMVMVGYAAGLRVSEIIHPAPKGHRQQQNGHQYQKSKGEKGPGSNVKRNSPGDFTRIL